MAIRADIQSLAPSARVTVYELDATAQGGAISRFHAGTNQLGTSVIWQGQAYLPWPITAEGFEWAAQGQPPRPKVAISNQNGLVSALLRDYDDLVGAKLTRKATLAKYLDAVNFTAGNPAADPSVFFPDEIYYVKRKTREAEVVEWDLGTLYDVQGVMLPLRPVIATCWWRYRGAECGYTGTNYFRATDEMTINPPEDVCGKRLSSCKARFGADAALPFGGMPAAGLVT
jgi:lambda family phage minor tail protein L